jgi:hypothetical protein
MTINITVEIKLDTTIRCYNLDTLIEETYMNLMNNIKTLK